MRVFAGWVNRHQVERRERRRSITSSAGPSERTMRRIPGRASRDTSFQPAPSADALNMFALGGQESNSADSRIGQTLDVDMPLFRLADRGAMVAGADQLIRLPGVPLQASSLASVPSEGRRPIGSATILEKQPQYRQTGIRCTDQKTKLLLTPTPQPHKSPYSRQSHQTRGNSARLRHRNDGLDARGIPRVAARIGRHGRKTDGLIVEGVE